jgi:hypothetical protein
MTQRIFDVENEKDMADLWDIVPENIVKIRKGYKSEDGYYFNFYDTNNTTGFYETLFLNINWNDKTETTRPIQEATEADIGKLCVFWDMDNEVEYFGILWRIYKDCKYRYQSRREDDFAHCRRLTKQEIEELY